MNIHSTNTSSVMPSAFKGANQSMTPTVLASSSATSGKMLPAVANPTHNIAPIKSGSAVNSENAQINNASTNSVAMSSVGVNNTAATALDQGSENAKAQDQALEQAVETVNEYVQTVQRDLHFSIDQESDRTVVKVIESSSGDIIRQIPNESFLELARKMKEFGEVSLVNATG